MTSGTQLPVTTSFTFHNVSIKSRFMLTMRLYFRTLHSTMYLLNQDEAPEFRRQLVALHSTMYLLNLLPVRSHLLNDLCFTFHNVSIKSAMIHLPKVLIIGFTIHNVSIKSITKPSLQESGINFTFHNVSIKSCSGKDRG